MCHQYQRRGFYHGSRPPPSRFPARFEKHGPRCRSWQRLYSYRVDAELPSHPSNKRYKCALKQVVGAPFSGLWSEQHGLKEVEETIIAEVLQASSRGFDDPGLHMSERTEMLNQLLTHIQSLLKRYLDPFLDTYLHSIADRLLDHQTTLKWDSKTNNCQSFVDALISRELFGPLTCPPPSATTTDEKAFDESEAKHQQLPAPPLYVFSFVTRPDSYLRSRVKTKYDVPNGLTEEYLLKFRYGLHEESDIIDSLQEYWHDWAAFDKAPYKYQDLFPWDCSEAFGRYPGVCGKDCNIAKHAWAFPFDTWSVCSLHLLRDPCLYPSIVGSVGDDKQGGDKPEKGRLWFLNRLHLLLAQSSLLTAATAMARLPSFHAATRWLIRQDDLSLDRLKLGGIHRAQPFGHLYDAGCYRHYFLADWTHLPLPERIAKYEELRDGRVKMPNVPVRPILPGPGDLWAGGTDGMYGLGSSGKVHSGNTVADAEVSGDWDDEPEMVDAGFAHGGHNPDGADSADGADGGANCVACAAAGCGSSGDGADAGGDGGCGGGSWD